MRMNVAIIIAFVVASSAFCAVDFEEITFGFNNGYKQGKWTPLTVNLQSQNSPVPFNGELTVEVRNYNTDETIYRYATPLHLSKTDRKQKKLSIYCPKSSFHLILQLEQSDIIDQDIESSMSKNVVMHEITPPTPIANKDYFGLVLAPSGDKIQKILNKKQLDEDGTQVHIKYLPNSRVMPTRWITYDAVDLIIIREVSLTDQRILKQQQTALLDWVQRGGTLVVSGGSNFRFIKDSFIEQLLPVKMISEETIDKVPPILKQQFGLITSNNPIQAFKNIYFEPKHGCQTLLGTDEQIYIAKRNMGSGQVICFSFDYNTPPFSELKPGETFWHWLLKTNGKSPKLFANKYAPFRQHEEKLHEHFLSKMPTQIPIIKLLTVILPIYLLSFGGITLYFSKKGRNVHNRNRGYWIVGLIFVIISVSIIGAARAVLPKNITTEQFSILSIYPQQKNAHMQSYVSLRAAARTKTTIPMSQNTFIHPLRMENTTKPAQFHFGSPSELREVSVEPWSPSTYIKETFFSLDTQQTPIKLENTWRITGEAAIYLGDVTLGKSNLWVSDSPSQALKKLPSLEGLNESRKTLAKILQQEGLLQYLLQQEDYRQNGKTQNRTVIIGWISQLVQDSTVNPHISANEFVSENNETLVIMSLDETDTGM